MLHHLAGLPAHCRWAGLLGGDVSACFFCVFGPANEVGADRRLQLQLDDEEELHEKDGNPTTSAAKRRGRPAAGA